MKMIKKLTIIGILIIVFVSFGTDALAAKPANQACLGEDFSGYARSGETNPASLVSFGPGVGFGTFISGLAQGTDGIGDEVQNHQAGLVPDTIISNSCND